jgi:sugar phosphate isomerase/epimerase
MLIRPTPPVHLTYGLNIHPGETWAEHREAIRVHACAVRDRVSPSAPFGLGLRISARAAEELDADPAQVGDFRRFLADHGLYAFTINGFPYGRFHGARVKEQVYAPDWRTPERRDYTVRLARVLAALLPEGMDGSISTVPGSYGAWIRTSDDLRRMTENLARCGADLARLEQQTGRRVRLGLEPEPDTSFPRISDGAAFLRDRVFPAAGRDEAGVREHVGLCLDTCHAALEGEDPLEALDIARRAGVAVVKIQISAAVSLRPDPAGLRSLRSFEEPVYLHQTRAFTGGRIAGRWADLPAARTDPAPPAADEWRVHFHVPLGWEGDGILRTTADSLGPAFWRRIFDGICSHLEIETYTFDVLPERVKEGGVVESIAGEFRWVLDRRPGGVSGRSE